ncbi:MAG: DUF5125 domain-containing protein [Bacteroidales bacterium]|nr:DUF5125 domain-containing protein [Bacteroidales bacterium]
MKRLIIAAALAIATLTACQPEVRQVKFTDKGPAVTVQSVDGLAYMGGSIAFAVDITDAEFTLSTLKVELLFDESVVESTTIRTKEYGVYQDFIRVPLYAKIPDGTATLRFTAQNTGLGITVVDKDVDIKRPDFDKLYVTIGGKDLEFPRVDKYKYALTGTFPADASTTLRTPKVNDRGDVVTLGWSGSAINASETPIPFKMGAAGTYTIEADLWELTASPLGKGSIDLSESNNTGVFNLVPDTPLLFPNIPTIGSWELDYDFFNVTNDGVVTFKAIAGLYKLRVDFSKKWIEVEAMENENDRAELDGTDPEAIWCIGQQFGKPGIGPSWNTTDGAYCLAQVAPGIHQFSLVYGTQLSSGFRIKFFHQKGWGRSDSKWGGEFKSYAAVNDETGLFDVASTGDIAAASGKQLEEGMGYRFTIDITGGVEAAVLNIKSVKLTEGLSISVNGVKAKGAGDVYKVALIPLKQGDALSISGDAGIDGFVPDPDFITPDGKFNAVDGNYAIELHLDATKKNVEFARFWRVDDAGNNVNLEGGGCYFMGGTVAFIYQNADVQKWPGIVNWPGTGGLQMAQVKPGIFQVSGYAVPALEGVTPYARWQTEAMNVKYFYQDGWGGEASGDHVLTDRALELLDPNRGDVGNIYLKEGVTLEEGAFYVMTIDFTGCTISGASLASGKEVIDFYKK